MPTADIVQKNQRAIGQATCPAGKNRKQYSVAGEPNVSLVVHATGERRLQFRARVPTGKRDANGKRIYEPIYEPLGRVGDVDLADVWAEAATMRANLARGMPIDGRKTVDDDATTVAQLIEEWRTRHLPFAQHRASTARDYASIIDLYILPALGDQPAGAMRKRKVIDMAEAIARGEFGKATTSRADRAVATLSSIYGWAIERDMDGIVMNPCQKVRKLHKPGKRHVALTADKIKRLWEVIDDDRFTRRVPARSTIFRLLLFTGQRLNEVVEAPQCEFQFDEDGLCTWTLPNERTKVQDNLRHDNIMKLGPYASQLWRDAIKQFGNDEYVFAQRRLDGKTPHVATSAISHSLKELRELFGLDITVHSLRHTVRTKMAQLAIDEHISRRCLNHSQTIGHDTHNMIYNGWKYSEEKHEAFVKVERDILEIVGEIAPQSKDSTVATLDDIALARSANARRRASAGVQSSEQLNDKTDSQKSLGLRQVEAAACDP